MKTKFAIFTLALILFSCEEIVTITFSESSLVFNNNAFVEINIPKAEGSYQLSKQINNTIDNHIANMLSFSEDSLDSIFLNDAIKMFDDEYSRFKNDLKKAL